MFAVISNRVLLYLGNNENEARKAFRSDPNSILHEDVTLEFLSKMLGFDTPKPSDEEPLSNAVKTLVQKLEELGISQELTDKVQESSERVLTEVKFLGLRGMRTVGEGFVALGDLLRKAGEDKEENNVQSDR